MALGGLPLALEQAAAYMRATGSPGGVFVAVPGPAGNLLARGEAAGHPADVATTLGWPCPGLRRWHRPAAGLARLLAFLAPEPVPLALLQLASWRRAPGWPGGSRDRAAARGSGRGRDAITALRQYSLISPAGDGLVWSTA